MNPKDGFEYNEILCHFLIRAEGGAKNYKREHPLPFRAILYRCFRAAKGIQRLFSNYSATIKRLYSDY